MGQENSGDRRELSHSAVTRYGSNSQLLFLSFLRCIYPTVVFDFIRCPTFSTTTTMPVATTNSAGNITGYSAFSSQLAEAKSRLNAVAATALRIRQQQQK